MPKLTIFFGGILIAIGLFGYFGSASENPSPTALIPAAFGAIMAICGAVAHFKPNLRMHAMHVSVLVALIGLIAALARMIPNVGKMISDDLSLSRPLRLMLLMAVTCLVYVIWSITIFVSARRARLAKAAGSES